MRTEHKMTHTSRQMLLATVLLLDIVRNVLEHGSVVEYGEGGGEERERFILGFTL